MCYDLNMAIFRCALSQSGLPEQKEWDFTRIDDNWTDLNVVQQVFEKSLPCLSPYIDKIREYNPEIIGFSVFSTTAYFSYFLTRHFRIEFPDAKIIWGGPECYENFGRVEYIAKHIPEIDVIFTGYSCGIAPAVVDFFEKYSVFPASAPGYLNTNVNSNTSFISADTDFNQTPVADFRAFNVADYAMQYFPVWVNKGCVNRCAFCQECRANTTYEWRDPGIIAKEIAHYKTELPQIQHFWLTSSNIGGNLNKLIELSELLMNAAPGISWVSQISVHMQLTLPVLELMKDSGCNCLYFGIESGSNKVLRLMNKPITRKLIKQVVRNTVKVGISFNFNLIVGFPGETISDFIKTLFLIHHFRRYGISPSVATCKIIPNSTLFMQPEKYGIINHTQDNWLTEDRKNTLQTRNKRKQIAERAFSGSLINMFQIPYRLFLFAQYYGNNKASGVKYSLVIPANILSKLLFMISFIPFVIWISVISIRLKYNELRLINT